MVKNTETKIAGYKEVEDDYLGDIKIPARINTFLNIKQTVSKQDLTKMLPQSAENEAVNDLFDDLQEVQIRRLCISTILSGHSNTWLGGKTENTITQVYPSPMNANKILSNENKIVQVITNHYASDITLQHDISGNPSKLYQIHRKAVMNVKQQDAL